MATRSTPSRWPTPAPAWWSPGTTATSSRWSSTSLAELIARETVLAEPPRGRISRQSRSFPIKPRVDLRPDERGQYYLLSLSATDRTGLLYAIARVLARHRVSVHTARINTLGERVEDVFLLDGRRLTQDNKLQLALESELLEALAI